MLVNAEPSELLPDLPLEIHALIVEGLFTEKFSLTAYSQTCHVILDLCREHTFKSITLVLPANSEAQLRRLREFVSILRKSPAIRDFVRNLFLVVHDLDFKLDEKAVLDTLFSKSFSIESLSLTTFGQKWGKLFKSPDLGPLMFYFLSSPRLTSLELRGMEEFKLADLSQCPNLSSLYLKLLPVETSLPIYLYEKASPKIYLPPKLQHLNIDHASIDIFDPCTAKSTTSSTFQLKTLQSSLRALGLAQLIFLNVVGLEAFTLNWNCTFLSY